MLHFSLSFPFIYSDCFFPFRLQPNCILPETKELRSTCLLLLSWRAAMSCTTWGTHAWSSLISDFVPGVALGAANGQVWNEAPFGVLELDKFKHSSKVMSRGHIIDMIMHTLLQKSLSDVIRTWSVLRCDPPRLSAGWKKIAPDWPDLLNLPQCHQLSFAAHCHELLEVNLCIAIKIKVFQRLNLRKVRFDAYHTAGYGLWGLGQLSSLKVAKQTASCDLCTHGRGRLNWKLFRWHRQLIRLPKHCKLEGDSTAVSGLLLAHLCF